jgi:two-component system cell cycle sensor histidine kinase/response regulator CckA
MAIDEKLQLLIVEDSEDDAELLLRELTAGSFNVEHRRVDTPEGLKDALAAKRWDLVIADYTMPRFSGIEALAMVRVAGGDVPFIFVSGTIGEEIAVDALKAGAQDYLVKGKTKRLLPAIARELRDVEARRRHAASEAERRAIEERYRQVLSIAADGIIVAGDDLGIMIFNRGAERIFGHSAGAVVGQPLDILWPQRLIATNRRRIAALLSSPESSESGNAGELTALRATGEEFPVEATFSCLREDARRTVTVILRDIGDRQRADKKLRQLSRAVEQSANLVIIADADGSIEYVNPRFFEATGYAPGEIIGRKPFFWQAPRNGGATSEEVWAAVLAGRDWRGEFENRRKDGTTISVSATVSPVTDDSGAIAHVIAIEEDTTRRKEMEVQLQQAQKMEAIGLLTGGIAHDFNNLLAVIIGNLDLLSSQLGEDDESQTGIQIALAASLRGADLTRQLLAFSRQQPLSPHIFDMNALVTETMTMLRRIIGEKIEIRTDLAPSLWSTEADASQVETALANLSINARDAMPEGGVLSIATRNGHIDRDGVGKPGFPAGDYVVLSVKDTGTGIPPEILERVCEPFFTTKPVGKGTGLGLSMVYRFAEQSGGDLRIKSEVGRGTTITLYLPRAKLEERDCSPALEMEPVQPLEMARILVVEDNAEVREVVVRQLVELGYKVDSVASAAAAFSMLKNGKSFDLVFAGIERDGGETSHRLAHEIRALHPAIKILLTSGLPAARGNGGDIADKMDFIAKPYRRQELARKVRAVLHGAA